MEKTGLNKLLNKVGYSTSYSTRSVGFTLHFYQSKNFYSLLIQSWRRHAIIRPKCEAPMNEPVLVLNANFAPINVCSTRRAVGLMLAGKASMVLNGRGKIVTVSNNFPRPSIIRLEHMVKRPRPVVKLNKREIFRRDNYTCQYCGKRTGRLTLDHVIPRHLGGSYSWENIVTACPDCNHKKGGRTAEQAGMDIRNPPRRPHANAEYIFGRYMFNYGDWQPFLQGW